MTIADEEALTALLAILRDASLRYASRDDLREALATHGLKLLYVGPPKESCPAEPSRNGLADLSSQEKELLDLVIAGQQSKQIAAQYHVPIGTIQSRTSKLFRKFGARNRADLVRIVLSAKSEISQ